MNVNNLLNIFAGSVIMLSLTIGHLSSQIEMTQPSWLWLTFFVGANLFQMGFTGFCPARMVFKRLGAKDSSTSSCCS